MDFAHAPQLMVESQVRTNDVTDTRLLAALPPVVCARLLEGGNAPLGVRAIFTGGGPVFPNLLHALAAAAPQAAIHAVYGSTEAEPIAHVAYADIDAADWRAMEAGGGLADALMSA